MCIHSIQTENLAFYGIKIYIGADGERAELCGADTVVYTDSSSFDLHLEANEIRWYNL